MIDVVMPQMGESIVEGTLTKWLKKAGDRVERDEPLFEISTDKVDTEIPSPSAGVLAEILVEEGKTVAINTVVARIDETGEARPAAVAPAAAAETVQPAPPPVAAAQAEPAPAETAAPAPETAAEPSEAELGPISPLVRKMAREHNINLREIRGTGAGGRITKQDVEAYLAARAAQRAAERPAAAPPPAAAVAAPPAPEVTPAAPAIEIPPARAEAPKTRIEPMSIMRSKIAEHMVLSKRTSAHVTTVHRIDMTAVARLRERFKEEVKARYGYSLTFLPFFVRAACEALRAFPIVNASIEGSNIIYHN